MGLFNQNQDIREMLMTIIANQNKMKETLEGLTTAKPTPEVTTETTEETTSSSINKQRVPRTLSIKEDQRYYEVTNTITGEKSKFTSCEKIAKVIGCAKATVQRYVKLGKLLYVEGNIYSIEVKNKDNYVSGTYRKTYYKVLDLKTQEVKKAPSYASLGRLLGVAPATARRYALSQLPLRMDKKEYMITIVNPNTPKDKHIIKHQSDFGIVATD